MSGSEHYYHKKENDPQWYEKKLEQNRRWKEENKDRIIRYSGQCTTPKALSTTNSDDNAAVNGINNVAIEGIMSMKQGIQQKPCSNDHQEYNKDSVWVAGKHCQIKHRACEPYKAQDTSKLVVGY